jgi:hypothetical protein
MAIVTALATAAAAGPVRLGEDELGAVAITRADIRAAASAGDWLRGDPWGHDPQLTLRLDPTRTLRPSRPSEPQAVQAFVLGATED